MQNQTLEQVISTLSQANNVLVTVKNSPSIDELASAVGLTLALNKAGKHATTVFSGQIPSTIEFLQPETVIDSTTDSLRDFIISLDKSKADKLRYKVEDDVVRIFITPYRSSITSDDLEFTQGDFNVDAVVAIGVVSQQDFDTAISSHGRIMHDATVISMTKRDLPSQIGAINWHEPAISSICEMAARVTDGLNPQLLDGQMATAYLTGVIAETDRFRNSFTTPSVMSLSSRLMMAGANQQLVAAELEKPEEVPLSEQIMPAHEAEQPKSPDGTLEIAHSDDEDKLHAIHIDEDGTVASAANKEEPVLDNSTSVEQSFNGDEQAATLEEPLAADTDFMKQYTETPLSTSPPQVPQPSELAEAEAVPEPNLNKLSEGPKPPEYRPVTEATEEEQPPSEPAPVVLPPAPPHEPEPVAEQVNKLEPAASEEKTPDAKEATNGHQLLSSNEPESNNEEGGDNTEPQHSTPIMQHKHKTLQPISDEFQTKKPQNPLSNLDLEDTSDDKLEQIRKSIDETAKDKPVPKQNIGALHVDLEKEDDVKPESKDSSEQVLNQVQPKPLVSSSDSPKVEDSTKPPAVPPPLMPPPSAQGASSGPQFYDANGQQTDPLSR